MLPVASLFGVKRLVRSVEEGAAAAVDTSAAALPPSPLCDRAAQLRFAADDTSTLPNEAVAACSFAASLDAGGGSSKRLVLPAPSGAPSQPSVLLLTQNIGSIDFLTPSSATTREVHGGKTSTLTLAQRRVVDEFVADMRAWLHRIAWLHAHMQHAAEHATQSGQTDSHDGGSSDVGVDALADADVFTRAPPDMARASVAMLRRDGYSTTSTPPLLDVFVLHLQEVGGKQRHDALAQYLHTALSQRLLPEAGWCSGLLMDGDDARGRFTALGTVVFVAPRMCAITSALSFPHRTYLPVVDDPCSYGGARTHVYHTARFASLVATDDDDDDDDDDDGSDGSSPTTTSAAADTAAADATLASASPVHGARKGFLLVSLRLGTVPLHCCNVHLPHDASNARAFARSPSVYATRRRACLLEAMAECLCVVDKDEPLFVFGDVNVRLDAAALARYVAEQWHMVLRPHGSRGKHSNNNNNSGCSGSGLRCPEAFWQRLREHGAAQSLLRARFDCEARALLDAVAQQSGMALAELPVQFTATYSRVPRRVAMPTVVTDTSKHNDNHNHSIDNVVDDRDDDVLYASGVMADRMRDFCRTRVPAWCDRVVFNAAALELLAGGCSTATATPAPRDTRTATAARDVHGGGNKNDNDDGDNTRVDATTSRSVRAALLQSVDAAMLQRRYVYDAISFVHTDHDGVFVLF